METPGGPPASAMTVTGATTQLDTTQAAWRARRLAAPVDADDVHVVPPAITTRPRENLVAGEGLGPASDMLVRGDDDARP